MWIVLDTMRIQETFLCVLLTCYLAVESSKILAVFPFPSKSHYAIGSSLLKEMARRGHEVTMISVHEEKNLPSNISYRQIKVDLSLSKESKPRDFFSREMADPYLETFTLNHVGNGMVDITLRSPQVKKLLESGEKFDAVIMDQFVDDGLAYLSNHFSAIHILVSTSCANSWVNPLVANPAPPSVNPELLLGLSESMTFFERLRNTIFYAFLEFNRRFLFFPRQEEIIKEHFPKSGPLSDYIYNASLVLMNAHESLNDPIALVPAMKNVGGLHVSPSGKLPIDLQKFMDDAEEGVVYFSMGSNLKSKDLPVNIKEALLRIFAKLPMKVLWKWEDETLPGQPNNVKLGKWMPQQEILAHPNLKVFITHGGLLSTIEAVYHGVPLLTFPVYGDQKINAVTAQQKGYALNVPYAEFEEGRFEKTLNELLNNPRYKQNAVKRSKLFHDRPMKPMDEAIFWVEYVIRHQGAPHFRVAALKLKWYQYILLDVMAFLLAVAVVIFYVLRKIVQKLRVVRKTKVQ